MESGAALVIFLMSCICVITLNGSFNFRIHGNRGDCPEPCYCVKFEGVPSVFCNGTGLTEVPDGIPDDTEFLDISNNSIKFIPAGVLSGLENLIKLDASSNGLSDNSIESGALDLPNLETVDLSMNKFTMIPKYLPISVQVLFLAFNQLEILWGTSFVMLPRIEYLDLSNNQLSKIDPFTFAPTQRLQTVFFLYNKLTDDSLPPKLFQHNSNLKMVMFCFNQFESMVEDLPDSIEGIGYVGNKLTRLPAYAFQSLPRIQNMELWENQIRVIEDNAFYGLHNLTRLNLVANQITTITNHTLSGLSNLQHLRLDINRVASIEPGALATLPALRSLWLNSNQLTTLDEGVLADDNIPSLCELHIKSNPWQCDCHLRWLREKIANASFTVPNMRFIVCAGPEKVAGKSWAQLKPSDFVC